MKIETAAVPVRSLASFLPTTARAAVAQPVDSFSAAPTSISQVAAVEPAPVSLRGFEATAIAVRGDSAFEITGKLPSGEEVTVVAQLDEQGKLSAGRFRLLGHGGRLLTRAEIGELGFWMFSDTTVSGSKADGTVPTADEVRAAINDAVDEPFEGFTPTEVLQCADGFLFNIMGTYANGDLGVLTVGTDGAGHVAGVDSERALDGPEGRSWATHTLTLEEMGRLVAALKAAPGMPMRAVDDLPPIGVEALTAQIQAAVDAA